MQRWKVVLMILHKMNFLKEFLDFLNSCLMLMKEILKNLWIKSLLNWENDFILFYFLIKI